MSNATYKVPSSRKYFDDTRDKWFFVGGATSTGPYVNGAMMGTPIMGASKAGYLANFDDSQAMIFLGLLDMPQVFPNSMIISTTADGIVEGFVNLPQWINMPLNTGTASKATDIGKPVFAVDNAHVTLNPSLTTYQNMVGWVQEVDSGASSPQSLTGPNVWIKPISPGGSGGVGWKQSPILFGGFRKPADFGTVLPNAGTSGILGVVEGTYLTSEPVIKTFDVHGATTSNGARFMFSVPSSYLAGTTIYVAITAGMTVAASVSSTLQVDAVRYAAAGTNIGPGSGATQSINSTSLATKIFTLTSTNIVPGDILDVRVQINVNDGGGSAFYGQISSVVMQLIS